MIDEIKNSIKTGKPVFIKSCLDYNFDWEDAIKTLSISYNFLLSDEHRDSYKNSSMLFNDKEKKFTSLMQAAKHGLTFHCTDLLERNNGLDPIKYNQVFAIHQELSNISDDFHTHLKLAVNMTENTPQLDPHRDPHHVLLTQVLGNARYVIHESDENDPYGSPIDVTGREHKEYLMEKNDILFMPKGTIHSIDNSSIRAAFIFDMISY